MDKLHSKETEKNLIGCLILSEELRINLASKLSVDIFYHEVNQKIYKVIYKLENQPNVKVDLATVSEELRRQDENIPVNYLTKCVNKIPTTANAESYYEQLYELHYRRKLAKSSQKNQQLAYDFDKDIDQITTEAESSIFNLTLDAEKNKGYNKISDNLFDHLDYMQKIDSDEGIVGIETPFTKLNEWTGGLKKGETTIIAARPKQGKSTIASNIAQYAAIENNVPVGLYSLEMKELKAVQRLLANLAFVNSHKLRNGTCSNEEWERISKAAEKLHSSPICINENPGLSIQDIRTDARKMKMKEDVELIVIDYAEKVDYAGEKLDKHERIFKIAEQISRMNKELDVHTILLSQVNRNCEFRNDKRPKMGDLKASSGLEQEANMIAFLYRENFYNTNTPKQFKDTTEFIVRANRDGEPQRCLLQFRRKFNRFENCPTDLARAYSKWIKSQEG